MPVGGVVEAQSTMVVALEGGGADGAEPAVVKLHTGPVAVFPAMVFDTIFQ